MFLSMFSATLANALSSLWSAKISQRMDTHEGHSLVQAIPMPWRNGEVQAISYEQVIDISPAPNIFAIGEIQGG
jgi:hypothetical protein